MNNHLFYLKMFSDDRIFITRAQMLAYERLYEKLEKCYLFFIGHDDINFTKLEDPVWIFDMKKWKASEGKFWSCTQTHENAL